MISDQKLQEVLAANEIVETVSSYVSLKKGGKDFKALCPFHSEKTPSFTVSPFKQIFHCFGCGAGGDVIGFVMKMEKLEFIEAVELLAQKKGIDVGSARGRGERPAGSDGIAKSRLYEVNQAAKEFFAGNLKQSIPAQEYLKKRGVTGITARDFGLGWAQDSWEGLLRWALLKGFSKKELLGAGLIIQSEETPGQYHDRFRARVIFPLVDTQGRVIGFSGRVLDDALPKYINSPETAIFNKGSTLFGLHLAKDAILKSGLVTVCEGPMDMIGVYQAGLRNIVASQGTAFTQRHAKLLKRFASRVVLCFDGDQAGQAATLRSLDVFLEEGMDVRIAVLPPKEDPDSFVRSRGLQAFSGLLSTAMDFLTFRLELLKKSYDLSNAMGRANASKEMMGELAKLPNAVYQHSGVQGLAELLNVREETLWLEFKKLQRPQGYKGMQTGKVLSEPATLPTAPLWEIDWAAAVLQNEEFLAAEARQEHFEMLSDPVLAGILRTAVGQWKMSTFRGVASVSVLFAGGPQAQLLARVASRPIRLVDAPEVYREGLQNFQKRQLESKIRELGNRIEQVEHSGQDASGLLLEVSRIKKELLLLGKEPATKSA